MSHLLFLKQNNYRMAQSQLCMDKTMEIYVCIHVKNQLSPWVIAMQSLWLASRSQETSASDNCISTVERLMLMTKRLTQMMSLLSSWSAMELSSDRKFNYIEYIAGGGVRGGNGRVTILDFVICVEKGLEMKTTKQFAV